MPSLQVRELPEQIYRKLRDQAQNEHRSISQQAIVTLAKGLDIDLESSKRRKMVIARIKEEAKAYQQFRLTSPELLVRKDRER